MIRYDISDADLDEKIEVESPGWLDRAVKRTAACRKLRAFDGGTSIWSDIKPVYMRLQHNKCAYCERKLEGEPYGRVEHDVEHFRPKNEVKAWPDARIRADRQIEYEFATGGDWHHGYFLLAFHPRNYITACKTCNTPLKANYFPIAGRRGPQSDDPAYLARELPYLLYPLGEHGDDPEELLTFDGIVPKPSIHSGHRHRRAVVTIDFLELDTREELLRDRALKIRELKLALIIQESGATGANAELAERTVEDLQSEKSPHANCVRSFLRLYHQNRQRAEAIFREIWNYLAGLDT